MPKYGVCVEFYEGGNLPSIVSADAPHANGVDGLCVQSVQAFGVDQLQGTVIQVHEQVLALRKKMENVYFGPSDI